MAPNAGLVAVAPPAGGVAVGARPMGVGEAKVGTATVISGTLVGVLVGGTGVPPIRQASAASSQQPIEAVRRGLNM